MRVPALFTACLLASVSLPLLADDEQRYSWSQDFSESERTGYSEAQGESQALPAWQETGLRVDDRPAELLQQRRAHCQDCSLPEVSLGNAQVDLIYDDDYDGFFHRFEVAFDVISQDLGEALYARLYLANAGGSWNFLYQTKDFVISGDPDRDRRVVVNALDSGYPAGYYDVRIELYDADTDAFVIDISADDDATLSGLPLEDYQRDDYYYYNGTQFYGYATGSLGVPGLLALAGAAALRRQRQRRLFKRS